MARTESDRQPVTLFLGDGEDGAPLSLRFEEVAMPLFESLHNFARWLAPNLSDAEDLVQETYLKAQRSFDSFQSGSNLRAWMFRILKNTFLSSRSTLDYRMTDTGQLAEEVAGPRTSPTPETLLITHHRNETTWRAILKLPDAYREVILLRDVEDVSYREIAEILSIPIGTVMSRLARGRRIVRESLLENRAPMGDRLRRGTRGKRAAAPIQARSRRPVRKLPNLDRIHQAGSKRGAPTPA
jgi:RNA polymerase sigma-70 factor (ECF subfamily)